METLAHRPFIDLFFSKALCPQCRALPKYSLITAATAKKTYFLNNNDLLPLKTMSAENPHHQHGPPVRLYSRETIRALSVTKLATAGVSLEKRRELQKTRGKKIKKGIQLARERRSMRLCEVLASRGIDSTDYCNVLKAFENGKWKFNHRTGKRVKWELEGVVEHVLRVHTD
jgi:hypothetical protein